MSRGLASLMTGQQRGAADNELMTWGWLGALPATFLLEYQTDPDFYEKYVIISASNPTN